MTHRYLKIFSDEKIHHFIEKKAKCDCEKVRELVPEINSYLEIIEDQKLGFFKQKFIDHCEPQDAVQYFRSHERVDIIKYTIQYLIAFISGLPMGDDAKKDPARPFEQMKSFVDFLVALLKEEDVLQIIIKKDARRGFVTDNNLWYYRGKVKQVSLELKQFVQRASEPDLNGYRRLFQSLQDLSVYWFAINELDPVRVRQTDVYIFLLTRFLLEKYC